MARRSKIGDALAGFSEGYDLVGKVGQDIELAKLGKEIPVETVNPETGVKTTEFLGRQYEGGLNQDQLDAARSSRMADIVGKYDPMRGLDMRRGLKRDAREDKAFDLQQRKGEKEISAMDQQASLLGFQIGKMKDDADSKKARREFQQSLAKMKDAELADHLGSSFNDSATPAMLTYDDRTNRFMLSSKIPGVKSQSLTRAELLREATAAWEMGNGDFNTGLQLQLQGIQERHQRQREMVGDAKDMAHGNADLAWKQKQYGLNAAHLRLQQQNAERDNSRLYGVQTGYMPGPNGELQPVLMGLRNSGKNGTVEGVTVNMNDKLPNGFIPEGAIQGWNKAAAGLIGSETGQLTDKGGKVLHTADSAYDAMQRLGIRAYTGRGGQNGGLDPNVIAKMPGFMNPAPAQAPAPSAAQAVPAPQQQGIRATFGSGGLRVPAQQPAAQGPQVMIQNGRAVPVFAPQQQQPMSYEEALGYLNR